MTTRPASIALASVLTALALGPLAAAAHAGDLWATVNICDTEAHPDTLGVRARMPGDGEHERMYMRFTAQFRSKDRWRQVDDGAVSRWIYVGSALYRNQEQGYTFHFQPPPKGETYLLRGLVQFQWRRGSRIVHRTHVYTTSHHHSRYADPKGYSASTCTIR